MACVPQVYSKDKAVAAILIESAQQLHSSEVCIHHKEVSETHTVLLMTVSILCMKVDGALEWSVCAGGEDWVVARWCSFLGCYG